MPLGLLRLSRSAFIGYYLCAGHFAKYISCIISFNAPPPPIPMRSTAVTPSFAAEGNEGQARTCLRARQEVRRI